MAAHDEKKWKENPSYPSRARAFQQGWRRVDVYGFERYEDHQRDWYILGSEQDATRFEQHDLELEARCMDRLWALILGDTPVYATCTHEPETEQAFDGLHDPHTSNSLKVCSL